MAKALTRQSVSETVYQAAEAVQGVVAKAHEIGDGVSKAIDTVVEYPGSRQGDPGWWRLTEWLEAKADQIMDHSSGRRR